MADMSKYELLAGLCFTEDPFKKSDFETAETARLKKVVRLAVMGHGMISIVGERGVGKTRAIYKALASLEVARVRVHDPERSKTCIGDIVQAMILDLSEEPPKRSREVRARQLRRVLGEASRKGQVVVVIEESHRLHPSTLKALKSLREIEWLGESDLFTVIMIGQSDPMNKAGVSEVRLRSDGLQMQGMTETERVKYITETCGMVIRDDAIIRRIAANPKTRNYLDMQDCLYGVMGAAYAAGRNQVSMEDVDYVFNERNGVRKIEQPAKKEASGNGIGAALAKRRQGADQKAAING